MAERSADYVLTESGLQYKDFRVGVEGAATPQKGDRVVVDWDGCVPNTSRLSTSACSSHLTLKACSRQKGTRESPVRTQGGCESPNTRRDAPVGVQPASLPARTHEIRHHRSSGVVEGKTVG